MADSDFWRDLAAEFLELSGTPDTLLANWQYRVKSGIVGNWEVRGTRTQIAQFEALARRGAMMLPGEGAPDLLDRWLEALRASGINFELGEFFTEQNDDGSRGPSWQLGKILKLCESSANHCMKLESAALQAEFEEKQRSDPRNRSGTGPQLIPAHNHPEPKELGPRTTKETVGAQINRLREECHLSTEELAEEVELEARSVQRHLAGKSIPYPRHLRAYERAFSKLLNRQVVIRKLS